MSDHCRWCITPKGSLAGSRDRAERFRSGILDLGFGPVDISNGIEWSADPFETRMWGFRLHNLQWLYDLYRVAAETGDEGASVAANEVISDWVAHNRDRSAAAGMAWDNHVTALRARVIVCSLMAFGGAFRDVLSEHARVITPVAVAESAWNHGTDQLLTLLTIGCALGDDELIEKSRDRFAVTLPYVIDEQGVSNEQAPGYDYYVWSQLEELAGLIEVCGLDEMPILRRRRKTPTFLAHSTQPDRTWAHIGDTVPARTHSIKGTSLDYALSGGGNGSPPEETVAVFKRGYVFGRSGWGEDRDFAHESWYSIRFGPGRRLHGHRDHTSFTWYASGRSLIVEAGFGGYDEDEFREYDRSEFAHNQVVAIGAGEYEADASTALANHGWGAGWESYLLSDRPYASIERRRSLLVDHQMPFLVIRDDLESLSGDECEFTSLLHLPPDVLEARATASGFVFELPSEEPLDLHAFLWGNDRVEVFRGWEGTGGWVSDGLLARAPAPVLGSRMSGVSVSMTTALIPASQTTVEATGTPDQLRLAVGAVESSVTYDRPSGLLRPVADEGSAWFRTLTKDPGRPGPGRRLVRRLRRLLRELEGPRWMK